MMVGLLEKAQKLRESLGLSSEGRDEFAYDPDSGISREDQKEILAEIDTVAAKSRMTVSPEAFAVKAAKKGIFFPIIVNISAILVLAVGLSTLYFFFQRGETAISQESVGTVTAEGKLIAELKKESEARLLEKNNQIDQIQGRLAEIDKERQDLQSNMDAKVRDREQQLRAAIAEELAAERTRLQKQGLSEQDIQKRVSDLESRKSSELSRQLNAYKAQAEAERKKSEESLKALESEFNANLAKANSERQEVLADSKKKQADLEAQLEQKTMEVESERAESDKALRALQSQKEKEDTASSQLVGLYSVVKADIAEKRYPKALQSIAAIRDFINSAEVAALPGIARRRDVDLFVVESLSALVQGEIDKGGGADTSSLVAAASQISEVRARVREADDLAREGKSAEAQKAYSQAIAVIPEIQRSYDFFANFTREGDAARQGRVQEALSRAEAAGSARRYSEMLAAYKDALTNLPESTPRIEKMISNLGAAALEQENQRSRTEQSREAAPILARAASLLSQKSYEEALDQYMVILTKYSRSSQVEDAAKGVSDSMNGLNIRVAERLSAREKETAGQIAALRAELEKGKSEIAGSKGATSDLAGQLKQEQERSKGLSARIDELTAKLKAAQDAAQKAAQQKPATVVEAPKDAGDARRRLDEINRLMESYKKYMAQEDAVIRSQGEEQGRMKTIGLRDNFLVSLDGMFKGLLGRIQRYDNRFIADAMVQGKQEGRSVALQQAIDIVIELAKKTTPAQRREFFESKLKALGGDPQIKSFLKNLQSLSADM